MSACTDFVIFVVVVLIFIPMANSEWRKALVGSYNASCFHVTIPILLNIRFIFFVKIFLPISINYSWRYFWRSFYQSPFISSFIY